MSKWARRQDGPHTDVRDTFEKLGLLVLDVSRLSGLGCDLIVFAVSTRHGAIVEVKDGQLAPSDRRLTDSEIRLAERAGRLYRVVGSVEDALDLARELLSC